MAQKIENMMGDLNGKVLAILGLAFKPNTDDMREAASITILNYIIKKVQRLEFMTCCNGRSKVGDFWILKIK